MAKKHKVVNDEVGVALVIRDGASDADVLRAIDAARDDYLGVE